MEETTQQQTEQPSGQAPTPEETPPQKRNVRTQKIIFYVVRAVVALLGWTAVMIMLNRYEFFAASGAVDNFIGALPIVFLVVAATAFSVFLLIRPDKRNRIVSVALVAVTVISIVLFPGSLSGNWSGGSSATVCTDTVDVSKYKPFDVGNQTVKLGETPTLYFTTDFPVLDGASAVAPLYAAVAETVYDKLCLETNSVKFTDAQKALEGLTAGERDVIFVSATQNIASGGAQYSDTELNFTPICKDAFVFVVDASNPTTDITPRQIRNIYSGKTARWKTLGWSDGGEIVALRTPENSDSYASFASIMQGSPIASARQFPSGASPTDGGMLQRISTEYNGIRPALGYTFGSFVSNSAAKSDIKILTVGGVAPTSENVKSGDYPYSVEYYAVTRNDSTIETDRLVEWLISDQGQRLVTLAGFIGV